MELFIRVANLSDYESLRPLFRQVHDLHVAKRPDLYRENQIPVGKEAFESQINDPRRHVFVAAAGAEIIGVAVTVEEDVTENPFLVARKVLLVDSLCVLEAWRGMGVGRMLMKSIMDFARSIHADAVELAVLEENASAISFYESIGMTTKSRKMEFGLK